MNINILKRCLSVACVALAFLLLAPTFVSLLSLTSPESSISLVIDNPLEEEREEERSAGEEDLNELKEFTIPSEYLNKEGHSVSLILEHQYTLRYYSSFLSILDLPPEILG